MMPPLRLELAIRTSSFRRANSRPMKLWPGVASRCRWRTHHRVRTDPNDEAGERAGFPYQSPVLRRTDSSPAWPYRGVGPAHGAERWRRGRWSGHKEASMSAHLGWHDDLVVRYVHSLGRASVWVPALVALLLVLSCPTRVVGQG